MRSASKREKRRKRNNLIIGLVMVFLMVFSILAFSLDPNSGQRGIYEHNGLIFNEKAVFDDQVLNQQLRKVYTEIEGEEVQFFTLPNIMNQVNVSENNLDALKTANMVYFSRHPLTVNQDDSLNLIFFDVLRLEFAKNAFIPSRQGLASHNVYEDDLGIINCENANEDSLVFILAQPNQGQPKIKEINDYCFEISGEGDNLILVSDYLLYKHHGVI